MNNSRGEVCHRLGKQRRGTNPRESSAVSPHRANYVKSPKLAIAILPAISYNIDMKYNNQEDIIYAVFN